MEIENQTTSWGHFHLRLTFLCVDNFGNSLNDIFQVTMVSPILYFNNIECTWFSGELGREAQDEFEEEGEGGSSLTQTPVEWQHSWHLHVISGCAYQN